MLATGSVPADVGRVAPIVLGRKDYWSVLFRLVGMDTYKVYRRLMSRILLLAGVLVIVGVFFLIGLAGWYTANRPLSSFAPVNCAVRAVEGCIKHPATQADMQRVR